MYAIHTFPFVISTVSCGDPDPLPYNAHQTNFGNTYGVVATYACDTGHEYSSGDTAMLCQPNGQWNGTALNCSRKRSHFTTNKLFFLRSIKSDSVVKADTYLWNPHISKTFLIFSDYTNATVVAYLCPLCASYFLSNYQHYTIIEKNIVRSS